jgi:hypothetical protein
MYRGYRGSIVSGVAGRSARGANTGHCSSAHYAGLLPGVQIPVGSAVASSGSARISAAIHPRPVQVELRPHSDASKPITRAKVWFGVNASNHNVCDVRYSPNCCHDAAVPRSVEKCHNQNSAARP